MVQEMESVKYSTNFKEILTKKKEEMKLLEKENTSLQVQHSAALDEIQRLRDDARPEVK